MNACIQAPLKNDSKAKALQRWKILKQVLTGSSSSETCTSDVSVRRFSSYGLLKTEPLSQELDGNVWYRYTAAGRPGFSMSVRHLPGKLDANKLLGFNNTGNVCVWPAEEVMTNYCLQHLEDFSGCCVCELGGGMTCLAGLALALESEAASVMLSDGNQESVENLDVILKEKDNCERFGNTQVSSRLICWGSDSKHEDLVRSFDFVLCADCLFFDEGRVDLADLIYDILKPDGRAILFAPRRGTTFQAFQELAQRRFRVEVQENYSQEVLDLHSKLRSSDNGLYDENIHFPLLMTLTKCS